MLGGRGAGGVGQLAGRVALEGTATRTSKQLKEELRSIGGAMSAEVTQLCPTNFDLSPAGQRRRNLVTLLSMQLGRQGMSPWLYGQDASYVLSEILNLSPEEIGDLAAAGVLE